jgi:homogentisate 1,2-dioxygenase
VIGLGALAGAIDTPYVPSRVASVAGLEASVFVCQDKLPWQRVAESDQILFVLEGVITLQSAAGDLHVSEGEVAVVPRNSSHKVQAGMRSIVLMLEETRDFVNARNGHHGAPSATPPTPEKINVAVAVANRDVFDWMPSGDVGRRAVRATRLEGRSEPFRARDESVLIIVYRGVLDFWSPSGSGTVVGSQMLVVPPGEEVSLTATRGATVLFVSDPLDEPPARSDQSHSEGVEGDGAA